jgi:DNA-binding GntR family transcriptional regulator
MMRVFAIQRSGHRKDELERIHKHHRAILDAVLKRDSEGTRRLLAKHIQASANERLEEFDRWERESHLTALEASAPYTM